MIVKIDEDIRKKILKFVDETVPGPSEEVWLVGSRAKGTAKPESDWDVAVFSPYMSSDPEALFTSNQVKEIEPGLKVELVIAHEIHRNDPRPYMTGLREFGIRLR